MKTTKQLKAVFDAAKKENQYYTFTDFQKDAKAFVKAIRKHELVCSITVSRSGMTRTFNFAHGFNGFLNICYNNKVTFDPVKVGGCGMDMFWHLLYRSAEDVLTRAEIEKWHINGECSRQTYL